MSDKLQLFNGFLCVHFGYKPESPKVNNLQVYHFVNIPLPLSSSW